MPGGAFREDSGVSGSDGADLVRLRTLGALRDLELDPLGLVGMFRTFESISPSSRSNWDLMMRTHPFAIDRVNTITDYSALLPPRPARKSSPDYSKMKARLAALPPPPAQSPMPRYRSFSRT